MAMTKKPVTAKKKVSPKKVAKRPAGGVAKVSPVRGMPVADWVKAKVSGWQAKTVAQLLDLARKAAPDATLSIKWGQPVFEQNGPLAFIKPAKAHVTFGFWRGAELADPDGLLEGDGDRMKHLKLPSADHPHAARLTAWIKQAVLLNRKAGDPTKRSG